VSTVQATGRRKQAIARVRLTPGSGKITANGREFADYFPSAVHRTLITEPLRLTDAEERYDIAVTLSGGGLSGQAGAFRLGITRALVDIDPDDRAKVKSAGLLTRDPRKKESKKYGLKKARKAPQYSKR
jgi:small subunit ribosomal protein S9